MKSPSITTITHLIVHLLVSLHVLDVYATKPTVAFAISPSLTLVSGSSIQNNNTNAMLVGYNIANPPGYADNPLIRVGQTITATYDGVSRHFLVTGILNEAGNPNPQSRWQWSAGPPLSQFMSGYKGSPPDYKDA